MTQSRCADCGLIEDAWVHIRHRIEGHPYGDGHDFRPAFKCKARTANTGGNDPNDCDWPTCGCDPYADKVIAALQESGFLPEAETNPNPVLATWQDARAFECDRADRAEERVRELERRNGDLTEMVQTLTSDMRRIAQELDAAKRSWNMP